MEEMDDLLEIQKVTGINIPVKSGTPWKKHETKLEKDKIKAKKLDAQKARGSRGKSTGREGSFSKKRSNNNPNNQRESKKGGTIRAGAGRPRTGVRGEPRSDQSYY
jgi:hypothetical protein